MPRQPPRIKQHQQHHWTVHSATLREREPLCRLCQAAGRTVPAVCADHKVPVSNGGSLHDPENIQPLCADCHRFKTGQEAHKRSIARGNYPAEGYVVLGAPAAGKSTLVADKAGSNDFVWDHDRVLAAIGGKDWTNKPESKPIAGALMNRLRIAMLEAWRDGHVPGRVWWVTTNVEEAKAITADFRSAQLLVLQPSLDTLAERIEARRWLTPEQRVDLLSVARNTWATIEASDWIRNRNVPITG